MSGNHRDKDDSEVALLPIGLRSSSSETSDDITAKALAHIETKKSNFVEKSHEATPRLTLAKPTRGKVKCLSCDGSFRSSDVKLKRVCLACKKLEFWRFGTGD